MCPPEAPQYGGLKVEQQNYPDVRLNPGAAPASAFGGGESAQAAFGASGDVAKQAGELAQQEQDRANQVAHLAADNEAAQFQAGLQATVSKMRGQDALGAHQYIQQAWSDFNQKQLDNSSNRDQQMAIMRSNSARSQELYRFTENHVAGQMEQFADEQTKAGIQNAINLAVMNPYDPSNIETQRSRAEAILQDQATRKGIYLGPDGQETDTYKAMKSEQLGSLDKTVIQAMLDKDEPQGIDAARQYLAAHKDGMAANEMLAVRRQLEGAETKQIGMESWQDLQGMKLPDGTPDTGRMESAIMARDDLTDQRKLQVVQFVKARAGEERMQFYQRQAGNERAFMNDLVDTRKQGMPMEQAMNLVDRYGSDDYDRQLKTIAVQKTYAPSEDSDPTAVVGLRERLEQGLATVRDVDSAYKNGVINTSDWDRLHGVAFRAVTEGHTPQMKYVNEQIKDLAKHNLPSDKSDLFQHAVDVQTSGMSPDEKWKAANDMLKVDPATQHSFPWRWGGSSQWQTSMQEQQAGQLAWGQAYQDVGRDQTLAIRDAVSRQTRSAARPADVDDYAKEFGGYDAIKRGTPVNNAIQSLSGMGKLATPANVKWLLSKVPDGRLRPGGGQ